MNRFLGQPGQVAGLALGATVVAGVGAVDDVKGLGPWRKLLAQAVAASIAYGFGYRIEAINIPGIGTIQMGLLAFPVTLFWFLGVINALNLIDGLDGLAAGIAFFASVSNFVIAYVNGAYVVALLSASLAGSLLGFLRYNFNPAKIFMGDSGSMFLGFALAATSLVGATTKSSTAVAILAPMVALGVPIFDTMLAMVRRALARQSIFSADRGHIHHRLLDLGLTHRRVVLMLYASSVLLAMAAVGIAFGRSWQLGGALALAGLVLFGLVRSAGLFQRPGARSLDGRREKQVRALSDQIREALVGLSRARGLEEVDSALNLVGDAKLLQINLRSVGDSVPDAVEVESSGELVYELRVGKQIHLLELRISAALAPIDADVQVLLGMLADACGEALSRISSEREPNKRPHLRIAAKATGTDA